MNCQVCKKECKIENMMIYEHRSEVFYACSLKCYEYLDDHKCKKYCRLMRMCQKCKYHFLFMDCIYKSKHWWCKQCQIRRKPRKIIKLRRDKQQITYKKYFGHNEII
jgi:hypothetical protein